MKSQRSDLRRERRTTKRPPGTIIKPPASPFTNAIQQASGWKERERITQDADRQRQAAYDLRGKSDAAYAAWEASLADFRGVLGAVYPEAFLKAIALLREKQPGNWNPILEFLEANPYFWGSGYTKGFCLTRLKQVDLMEAEIARLRTVVLAAVSRPECQHESRYYWRLAKRLDSAEFRAQLESLMENGKGYEQERALRILDILGGGLSPELKRRWGRLLLLSVSVPEMQDDFLRRLKSVRRMDSPELRSVLRRLMAEGEPQERARARWVLYALKELTSPTAPETS